MKILYIGVAGAFMVLAQPLSGQAPSSQAREVPTFAGNAQHTSVYLTPAANLNASRWTTSIDLRQTFGTTHYGAPLVTPENTIVVPVKTESDGFQIKLLDASTGQSRGTLGTDYLLPLHNWIPTYNPALATIAER